MSKKQPLRFAALIRVSTEKQEKQGESLRTQTTDNKTSVEHLEGTDISWYGGQEHGTPGHEKKEVDRLIRDARNRRFDAVIVTDADRWSRDNDKSKEGLEAFAANNIRFFVGVTEYNLFDPSHLLFLEMSAVIGKFYARNQKFKSISNRIHRARRGIPTGGKLPFGRTWDKDKQTWGPNNPKSEALIKDVAKRYLKGERLPDLAKSYRVNPSNLHKVLMQRCGTEWELRFVSKEFRIDVTVPFTIPRLLDDATIHALKQRAKTNKTRQAGSRSKNRYLLSGKVFCASCGHALSPQPHRSKNNYYRHGKRDGAAVCSCRPRPYVRCDSLEHTVIKRLLDFYGNPVAVQKAVEQATPNREETKELRQRLERIVADLDRIKRARAKSKRAADDELIPENEWRNDLASYKQREDQLKGEHDRICAVLDQLLTSEKIQTASKRVSDFVRNRYGKEVQRTSAVERAERKYIEQRALDINQLSWEEKRDLVDDVFKGVTLDGKPMGVYVELIEGQTAFRCKRWRFKLHGNAAIDGIYGKTEYVRKSALY